MGEPPNPTDLEPERAPPRAPRWVKAFGIVALVVVLVIVIMLLVGGEQHGPGRHASRGDATAASVGGSTSPGGEHGPWGT
jgi:hypothetical protein